MKLLPYGAIVILYFVFRTQIFQFFGAFVKSHQRVRATITSVRWATRRFQRPVVFAVASILYYIMLSTSFTPWRKELDFIQGQMSSGNATGWFFVFDCAALLAASAALGSVSASLAWATDLLLYVSRKETSTPRFRFRSNLYRGAILTAVVLFFTGLLGMKITLSIVNQAIASQSLSIQASTFIYNMPKSEVVRLADLESGAWYYHEGDTAMMAQVRLNVRAMYTTDRGDVFKTIGWVLHSRKHDLTRESPLRIISRTDGTHL